MGPLAEQEEALLFVSNFQEGMVLMQVIYRNINKLTCQAILDN